MPISKREFYNELQETNDGNVYLWPEYQKVLDCFSTCDFHSEAKILDIGCADGVFAGLLKRRLNLEELYGIDISEKAVANARGRGIKAVVLDIDSGDLPYEDNYFDGIFCGEFIEHLFDTDHLLDEIFRVLKPNGICILTTPNLGSLCNRVALLLGYQPFFTEVSLRYSVGYLLPILQKVGHLKLFTLRALVALVRIHNFKIKSIVGFGIKTNEGYGKRFKGIAILFNILMRNLPSLSSDLMMVLTKP